MKGHFLSIFSLFLLTSCSMFTQNDLYQESILSNYTKRIHNHKRLNRDVDIIPDKYNTGAREDTDFHKLTQEGAINDVYIKLSFDKDKPENNRYIITTYVPKDAPYFPNEAVIEDYDFSDANFKIYNPDRFDCKKTITFKNCKFKGFANCGPYDENKLFCVFDHCTFTGGVNEVNISLNWCKIGGFPTDAMNPLKNFICLNSFVHDLVPYGNEKGTHVDGFQIYGRDSTNGGNILFDNVRFEMPSIHFEGNTSAVNACVMFQLEFGNVNNCYFKNLICNGGGKWFPLYLSWGKTNKQTGDYFVQRNINLENIDVSNNFGTIFYSGSYNEKATVRNVDHFDKLYVSSVWKDKNNVTHVICTNDTSIDKVLTVKTDNGTFTFDIPHCPSNWALGGEIDKKVNPNESLVDKNGRSYMTYRYSDMPFDIDCQITQNITSITCFDDETQIRNVKDLKDLYN